MVEDLKQYVDSYAPSCTTSYTVLKLGCSIKTWMKFLEPYNLENFNNKYCVIPHSTYSMARPIQNVSCLCTCCGGVLNVGLVLFVSAISSAATS